MAWSYILEYENSVNPYPERKETIGNWKKYSVVDTGSTKSIIDKANKIRETGIKSKDALHIACAAALNCQFFITTDLLLLKKLIIFEQVKVVNPVDFINHLENL